MVIDLLTEADIQTRASRRRRRTPGLFKGPSSPFFDIDIDILIRVCRTSIGPCRR